MEQGEDDTTAAQKERRNLHRALNVATLGSFANMGIGVISALVISRIYGATILGEYALAYAAVALLPVATSLSEQAALVKLLTVQSPRAERGSGLVLATLTLSYGLTLVIAPIVAAVSALYLAWAADLPNAIAPMLCLVVGYVCLDKLSWNLDGVLSAYRMAGPLAIANVLNSAVTAAVAAMLALAYRSVWSLTIASLASSLIALGYRLFAVRSYLRWRVSRDAYRQGLRELPGIIRFGLRVLPGSLSQSLSSQAALWVLGATTPVAAVGAFSRAQSITIRITDLNYRLAAVIYPSLVRRAEADDGGRSFVADVVSSLGRTFAPLLVALCAAAGGSRTILSLFGQDFLKAEGAMAVLLVATGVSTATMIFGEALTALNRPELTSVGFVLGLIGTLAPIIPLSRSYGATGAAIAFLSGTVVSTGFLLGSLFRATRGAWAGHRLTTRTIQLVGACVVAYASVHYVQTVGGALLTIAVGIAFAGLIVWARLWAAKKANAANPRPGQVAG